MTICGDASGPWAWEITSGETDRVPGEGAIDRIGLASALPSDVPVSVGVPNALARAEGGSAERIARHAFVTATAVPVRAAKE